MAINIGQHGVLAPKGNSTTPSTWTGIDLGDTVTAIVVCITIYETGSSDGVVSGITYGGDPLTNSTLYYDSLSDGHCSIWFLNDPSVAASQSLVVTHGGTVTDITGSITEITGGNIAEESVGTPATGTSGDPTIAWTAAGEFSFACMLDDQTDANKVGVGGLATSIYITDVGDVVAAQCKIGSPSSLWWVDDDGDEDWVVVGAAFEEAEATTLVYKDIQAKWDMRELVNDDLQIKYDMFELISDNIQAKWDIFNLVGQETQAKWDMYELVGQEVQAKWDMRELVGQNIEAVWDILSSATQVFKDMQAKWDINNLVNQTIQAKYDIFELIGNEVQAKWDILNLAGQELQAKWDISILVTKSVETKWDILNLVNNSIQAVYDMRQLAGRSLQAKWDILGDAPPDEDGGKRSLRQMAYRWTSRMGR